MKILPVLFVGSLAVLTGGARAADTSFASRAQAMDYLRHELPKATAANPKYLTKADSTVSQWLTDDINFSADGRGGIKVTMRESFTQTKDGKTTPGRHEAAFSLADVDVSEFTEAGDVTPDGAAARGVLFACVRPECVAALWGGQPSASDRTDISLQDDATRARILAAFRRLQAE